jgi:acyl dehydratase
VTAVTVLDGLDAVRAAVGRDLGASDWQAVTAEAVELFAAATGGPVAAGIVPPFLVLSLSNCFLPEIVEVRGVDAGVNYGTERVRFPTPVPVGARLRGRASLVDATDVAGGVQTTIRITIDVDIDGSAQAACVIDSLSRWLGGAPDPAPR